MNTTFIKLALLLLIAATTLISGCVINQGNIAGRINGTPITYPAYMDSYRAHFNNFQVLNNRLPDNDEKDQIKLQTWRDATKYVILSNYFKKYNISATAQEAIDSLKNNVPEYILDSPNFQTNGVFDHQLYLQSLEYDTPQNMEPIRKHYQDSLIPILKLQSHLIQDELLSPDEKKLSSKILQSSADIEWTILDINSFDPVVSDEEVQVYYQNNLDQFNLDPFYSLVWTGIPVSPSQTDILNDSALADTIYLALLGGMPVADAVTKFSNAFPALLFKNSGYIRNDDLDPSVYALLISIEEGGYSKPVADSDGITIYQLEQRTKSMSSFNTLRIPYVPSQTSIDLSKPSADRALKLANTIGVTETASELNLALSQTGKLKPGDRWLDDDKIVQSIDSQLADKKAGYVFDPLYSEKLHSWLIIELTKTDLNGIKPLSDVKGIISKAIAATKRPQMAKYQAEQIITGVITPPANSRIQVFQAMSPADQLAGTDAENIFYQTIKRHFANEQQQYAVIGDQIWIPRVTAIYTDKTKAIPETDILMIFTANLPANWFDTWMDNKIKKANLRIFIN